MQGRFELHRKALAFSLSMVGFTLISTFFFYDGPLYIPHVQASAPTVDASLLTELTNRESRPLIQETMPLSLKAQWQKVALDQGQIKLKVLKQPILLMHSHNKTGSEAFDYASFLFEQMALGIGNADLASHMEALSMQAQTLGNAIRQASAYHYAGPPSDDMQHLQVRSSILFHLNGLNPNALITARYNQDGQLLEEDTPSNAAPEGESLRSFLAKAHTILNHPMAHQYPETMRLVRKEIDMLEDLAAHLTLRWESTLYCQQHRCNTMATYVRVYTQQSLPDKTLITASL